MSLSTGVIGFSAGLRTASKSFVSLNRSQLIPSRSFFSSPHTSQNPFLPSQNAKTGRWSPPKMSLRKQAVLVAKAAQTGQLDTLPPSPKLDRIRKRIEKLQESREYAEKAAQFRYAPETNAIFDDSTLTKKGTRGSRRRTPEELKEALETAKAEGYKGPYTGRKIVKMFKGSKVDRLSVVRKQKVKENMANMENTITKWKSEKAENKAKFKSPLPY